MKRIIYTFIYIFLFLNISNAKSIDTIASCDIYAATNREMKIAIDSIVQEWKNCAYFQCFHTFPMLLIQIYDDGCDLEMYPYSKTVYTRFCTDNRIKYSGYILSQEALVIVQDFSENKRINDFFTLHKKNQTIYLSENNNLIDHLYPPFNQSFAIRYDICDKHLLNEDRFECECKDALFEFLYLVKFGDTWETIADDLKVDANILKPQAKDFEILPIYLDYKEAQKV